MVISHPMPFLLGSMVTRIVERNSLSTELATWNSHFAETAAAFVKFSIEKHH